MPEALIYITSIYLPLPFPTYLSSSGGHCSHSEDAFLADLLSGDENIDADEDTLARRLLRGRKSASRTCVYYLGEIGRHMVVQCYKHVR